MAEEENRTEHRQSFNLPPPDAEDGLIRPGPYERFLDWAAGLPYWAIILIVVAVAVLYSMLSSEAYRDVLQRLTDDPQVSTDDLFEVVQIVGEPTMVTGRYVGETLDTIPVVVDQMLEEVAGFVMAETPAALTIRTDDGVITIPKRQITSEERTEDAQGTAITVTYINRITVTGVLTEQNDDTMRVRTVDEERVTFDTNRILSRQTRTVACDQATDPGCEDQELTTIQRQGEILEGTLNTLSATNMNIDLPDGSREIRRGDVDYLYLPTLTIAVNERDAGVPILPGDEVRVGYLEGTDINAALDDPESLEEMGVRLFYSDGNAQVTLVAYPDLETALRATGAGEVNALVYLSDGLDRMAVQDWVEANPGAGVVLPTPPRECTQGCRVTVKLVDDEVGGRVVEETADEITLVTVEAEYMVIDRDKILEDRRREPGVCALNNLRGCDAGIFLTLRVTVVAYFLALLLGLIFGLMRIQSNPVLYAVSTLYVEVVRGIPLLVILLYAGFVIGPELRDGWTLFDLHWISDSLPDSSIVLKFELSAEQQAILGLAFGYGAFVSEIFRAGIQSISRGQMEAARSLGMSYPQAMRFVVLPQAIRVVLPPLGNDFISMLKDSALISVLALPDLLQLGRLYVSRTYRAFEGYNTVAILYLLMTLFLSMMVRIIERRSRLPR